MKLPSRDLCFSMFKLYHTPAHVIKHCLVVNKISNFLSDCLTQAGIEVNHDLVDRASLLHDILRISDIQGDLFAYALPEDQTEENRRIWLVQRELYQHQHHAKVGAALFKEIYPEMAEVIRKHRLGAILSNELQTWEEKIVYYADKRVNHDQFCNVDERMSEGKKRWHIKKEDDKSTEILLKLKEVENEIFSVINKKPEIINDL